MFERVSSRWSAAQWAAYEDLQTNTPRTTTFNILVNPHISTVDQSDEYIQSWKRRLVEEAFKLQDAQTAQEALGTEVLQRVISSRIDGIPATEIGNRFHLLHVHFILHIRHHPEDRIDIRNVSRQLGYYFSRVLSIPGVFVNAELDLSAIHTSNYVRKQRIANQVRIM